MNSADTELYWTAAIHRIKDTMDFLLFTELFARVLIINSLTHTIYINKSTIEWIISRLFVHVLQHTYLDFNKLSVFDNMFLVDVNTWKRQTSTTEHAPCWAICICIWNMLFSTMLSRDKLAVMDFLRILVIYIQRSLKRNC